MQEKTFVVFVDFLQTVKEFPTNNFISVILSVIIILYTKCSYQKQSLKNFLNYIMRKSCETFLRVTLSFTVVCINHDMQTSTVYS